MCGAYKNISIKDAVYDDLCKLSLKGYDAPLSLAKTIEFLIAEKKQSLSFEDQLRIFGKKHYD